MTLTITKPTVNGSNNTWGDTINTALDGIVSHVNNLQTMPSGGIIMWSGSVASIPSGWVICDGTNSTPDLRDRFVVGAGDGYSVDDTGGSANTTLGTSNLPAHSHNFSGNTSGAGDHRHNLTFGTSNGGNSYFYNGQIGSTGGIDANNAMGSSGNHTHSFSGTTANTGSGTALDTRPPYYALAFIMKT